MADELLPVGQQGNKKKLLDMTGYFAEVVASILQAGTAIIGKVGIDQTTPGTTNRVDATLGTVVPALDNTNVQAVSLRGKTTVAGDTALMAAKAGGGALTTAEILAVQPHLINNGTQSVPLNGANGEGDSRNGTYFGTTAQHLWNGASYDRRRNVYDQVALASAARAAAGEVASGDMTVFNARGIVINLDVTAVSGAANISAVKVRFRGPGSNYVSQLVFSALTVNSTGSKFYLVYPGIQVIAGSQISAVLPKTIAIAVTTDTADSITFGVNVTWLL